MCMPWANISLPVPLSPVIITAASERAICLPLFTASRMALLVPMISSKVYLALWLVPYSLERMSCCLVSASSKSFSVMICPATLSPERISTADAIRLLSPVLISFSQALFTSSSGSSSSMLNPRSTLERWDISCLAFSLHRYTRPTTSVMIIPSFIRFMRVFSLSDIFSLSLSSLSMLESM